MEVFDFDKQKEKINKKFAFSNIVKVIDSNDFDEYYKHIKPSFNKIVVKIIEDFKPLKIKEINNWRCIICEKNKGQSFESIFNLIFHLIIFHDDYYIHGFKKLTKKTNKKIWLNLIIKKNLDFKTHLVCGTLKKNLENLEIVASKLISRVFMHEQFDTLKIISYYKKRNVEKNETSFEKLINNLEMNPDLQKKNISKIKNLILHDKTAQFLEIWNFFIKNLKNDIFISNHLFTNFFQTSDELFFLCSIFIEKYKKNISSLNTEIKYHFLILFLNQQISNRQYVILLNEIK